MIKDMAWNTFKNTGSLDTFLELKQIENIQNNIMMQKVDTNGNNKNQGNNNCRK